MSTPRGQKLALAGSLAGLALVPLLLLPDLASREPAFDEAQFSAMAAATLIAVGCSYALPQPAANRVRRAAAGLWLALAIAGAALYPAEWLGDYLVRFVVAGGLAWLAADRAAEASASHSYLTIIAIGALCGGLCLGFRLAVQPGPGDFRWPLSMAESLLRGQDPYALTPSAMDVPYPLPAALFGLPLLFLAPPVAAAVFFGLSAMLLAHGVLKEGQLWRLLLFISIPFSQALMYAQLSPLIVAAWFLPVLAPLLVLVKPQTALPVALNRLTWRGVLLAAAVLAVSLAVYPAWPLRWLSTLGGYQQVIPALTLPLGPLLLLAALFPRDARARLLLFMSLLPMRQGYDLVPLFLIPASKPQMLLLVTLSWWNPLAYLFIAAGYPAVEANSYHFYALCILLYSNRAIIRSGWARVGQAVKGWVSVVRPGDRPPRLAAEAGGV